MSFGIIPIASGPLSSLGVTSISATSALEVIATLVADGVLSSAAVASSDAVAILEAAGTLTLGGAKAELNVIASILATSTVRGSDGEIFIWTAPARPTTWSFSEAYNGDKLIWVIPTGVGASTWVLPK